MFWHSGTLALSPDARVPKCQKIKKGGLDQYGPKHFEVLTFDTTGLERVKLINAYAILMSITTVKVIR